MRTTPETPFTVEKREELHDLYRNAVSLHGQASVGISKWGDAFAADKAFTDALYSIEVR